MPIENHKAYAVREASGRGVIAIFLFSYRIYVDQRYAKGSGQVSLAKAYAGFAKGGESHSLAVSRQNRSGCYN